MCSWWTEFVPFLTRKHYRLTVDNFSNRKGMIIRPIRKIDKDAAGFLRDTDTGDLLVRKPGDFLQLSSGTRCGDGDEYDKKYAWVPTTGTRRVLPVVGLTMAPINARCGQVFLGALCGLCG
jgi:hypothetical protein